MRADRLLSIVLLLQRHNHMTAEALATTLGVTRRTIYRDIDALNMAGVPVYTRTGPDGGCFLDETYRTSLNWFTGAELQTLLYAGSAATLSELGMQETMDHAVVKLLALLPGRLQQDAEQMRQRLYLDPSGWYGATDEHPALPTLKEAVWEDRIVDVMYENWEGHQEPRTLLPYSLVYKAGRWYVVAESDANSDLRTYRVSRLTDARLRSTTFERNVDFDVAAYWEQAVQGFQNRLPTYPVIMRVRPSTKTYFTHVLTGRYDILDQNDEWWTLKVYFTVFEEALTSALGLGTDAEVLEPAELQAAVIEKARAIVEKYNEHQPQKD